MSDCRCLAEPFGIETFAICKLKISSIDHQRLPNVSLHSIKEALGLV